MITYDGYYENIYYHFSFPKELVIWETTEPYFNMYIGEKLTFHTMDEGLLIFNFPFLKNEVSYNREILIYPEEMHGEYRCLKYMEYSKFEKLKAFL